MDVVAAVSKAEKKFVSVMQMVGHDAKLGLNVASRYMPAAAQIAGLLFPQDKAVISSVVNATGLIQAAVVTIEQKYVNANISTGNGPQKLADVLTIVSPTVTDLLTKEGLHVDQEFITNIVNAVVAILKVQGQAALPASA
jgi:hypothetical protein